MAPTVIVDLLMSGNVLVFLLAFVCNWLTRWWASTVSYNPEYLLALFPSLDTLYLDRLSHSRDSAYNPKSKWKRRRVVLPLNMRTLDFMPGVHPYSFRLLYFHMFILPTTKSMSSKSMGHALFSYLKISFELSTNVSFI